jgi:hypothetical protein
MKSDFENITPQLEINEHAESHKQGFKIQRIGMFAIIAFVLLAALGLFGDGVLSKRSASSKSAMIEYQRFYRFEARMEIKIELLAFGNSNVVSFPKEYLKEFQIESITPSAESTNFKGSRSEFVFNGPGNGIITFYLVPRKVGNVEGEILVNGESFTLSHFIYP